jgi:zinc protease
MATPTVERSRLDNGLEILVVESHGAPLVTIEFAVKGGAMVETPSLSGVSHLHEHMFLRASQSLPTPQAFQARWRQLGLEGNGKADMERVSFHITTIKERRAEAMTFLRDTLLSPRFDEEGLQREREVVIGELDRKESDPAYLLLDRVDQLLWWKHPNRKSPMGDRRSILSATAAKLQTVQRRYYVPNNALLVVTGDVQARTIFKEAADLYGSWKRGPDPFKKFPIVSHPPLRATKVVIVPQPGQDVKARMAWQGPSTVGPTAGDSYPAQLLSVMLQQPWSKFQNNIVYSGPCMGATFGWEAHRNTGPITLRFSTTADSADACLKAIIAELPRIKSPDYFSDEEMQLAARHFEMVAALERERPVDMAHDLTFWWAVAGMDYYDQRVRKVAAVSRDDIARYVDRYLLGQPYVLGVMLSPETIASGLDQAYFEAAIGIGGARKRS